MKLLFSSAAVGIVANLLASCASGPVLSADLQGKAAIVMGFATDNAKPYEGGTLYTGLLLEQVNTQTYSPALQRYDYVLVEPGPVTISGHCFWRLRGVMWDRPDDLWEPGTLSWEAQAGHVYTLFADIDEYKSRCLISFFDKAPAQ